MSDYCQWCITPKSSLAASKNRVERFRGGVLDLGFGPVDISEGIDWSCNPFGTRMWGFRFHNLQWLYDFYRLASETDDSVAAAEAQAVINDWVFHNKDPGTAPEMAWDDHVMALRARLLTCAVMAFGGPFHEALSQHAALLTPVALSEKPWNHGTDQLLTLLTIGCALKEQSLVEQALSRFSVTLPEVIDEEGVCNEQAPTYDYYVWSQLDELARLIASCGLPEMPILQRRDRTPVFLAHATRPDGRWAHIGDTTPKRTNSIPGTPLEYALSGGREGRAPEEFVAIYDRGYVFGRSGWGLERDFASESWYSIRFGPGRRHHGHRDHTSFTWYALGRPLIVEGGFGGYDDDAFREYDRSEFAHSQVVGVDAGPYQEGLMTSLVNHGWGTGWESYLLEDRPYRSVVRRRALFVEHGTPLMVVRDQLQSFSKKRPEFLSLLHLPADVSDPHPTAGGFVIDMPSKGSVQLHVDISGADRMEVFRGSEGTGGWFAEGLQQRRSAPVLAASAKGRRVSMTTVLAPSTGQAVRVSSSAEVTEVALGDSFLRVKHDKASGLLSPVGEIGEVWSRRLPMASPEVIKAARRWANTRSARLKRRLGSRA